MLGNKYGNFLTVLLVIIIIAIIGGLIFLGVTIFKPKDEEMERVMKELDDIGNNTVNEVAEPEDDELGNVVAPEPVENNGGGGTTTAPKKQYYSGFVMIGYIDIKKTGAKYPILERGTDKSLEVAVAVMYPDNPTEKLNKPGNVVIMGHNYRNGKFFSNNKKLEIGDKITIKDYTGTSVTYTIYEKFETTPEDTTYITRDTNGATEITLSTCTDDTKRRLIIKAKA